MEKLSLYPDKPWTCPVCYHRHSGPHYELPDQIDESKKPSEKGRIKFNRRAKSGDKLADDTPIRNDVPSEGDPIDEHGEPQGIMCPHCGYREDLVVIKRTGPLPDPVDKFLSGRTRISKTLKRTLGEFYAFVKRGGQFN